MAISRSADLLHLSFYDVVPYSKREERERGRN